ncbi:cytochrome c oxidase subunit I [Burkholderia pseudomallei]|nr:cytochrome c oxidase subunit I [Burkholderia pseudomallei]CAJ4796000.1 cytochrome c oxidase subunit I [Burkholderia pseudomallei]CAJ5644954.1 cytochrome c oxidase subunit I [Burkholderia pseudomallei]CAJ5690281.1 cytochrome c oxidase subunit I [Burkholderia pseudomallei]CAJ5705728.1 cytochrome c oxidase subunit I [Burkholderia pseudomallei]
MRSRTNGAIDTPRARRAQHRLLWACMLAGLVGAPALWMSQMLVSETLSSVACDPLGVPHALPQWPQFAGRLALFAALALLLGIACAALAWRGLRRSAAAAPRAARDADAEPPGPPGPPAPASPASPASPRTTDRAPAHAPARVPLDAANREPNAPGEPDELGELDELGEPDVPDEPDDAASKTRFIAVCGLLAGVGFALGLIFTGLAVIFVEPCHPWR